MSRRLRAISVHMLGLAALAAAGSFGSSGAFAAGVGDGSGANNAGLLRGAVAACSPGDATCDPFAVDIGARDAAPILLQPSPPVDVNDPGYGYPTGGPPHANVEASAPPLDLDWSVGLRGAYVSDTKGQRFEALIAPGATLSYEGSRTRVVLGANGELVRADQENVRLSTLRVTLGADYKFDLLTQIETDASLSLSQAGPDDPSLATGVLVAPQLVIGTFDTVFTRRFGRLDLALRGNLEREIYGASTLAGQISQDNSADNRSIIGGGLRLAYGVTPILKVFVDGSAAHDSFDATSASLGVKADGTSYAVKTGVSGEWGETLSAEASVGLGLRRFDVAGLSEVVSTLYDARVVYKPSRTLTLTGAFGTSFAPPGPNGTGTTRVEHTATADANYRVNSWLALRALASWSNADLVGTSITEKGYGLGLGADYVFNAHTAINADYGFGHSETVSNPSLDTHRVTLGVTISR